MSISISEVRSLAGCAMRRPFHHVLAFLPFCDAPARGAIDDDLDGCPETALTNVARMPFVLGLWGSAGALELERRPETVFGELEI
jgi:hypothetical protein